MSPDHQDRGIEIVERRLSDERPLPTPGFRAQLRHSLTSGAQPRQRPGGLRILIASYAVAGMALLSIVAFGLADVGPLDSQTNPVAEPQPTSSATDSSP